MRGLHEKVRPVTWGLAIYFVLIATDSFNIAHIGSFVKIIALLPVALLLLDLRFLRVYMHPIVVLQGGFLLLAFVSLFYSIDIDASKSSVLTLALNVTLVFALGAVGEYNKREIAILERALVIGGWVTVFLLFVFADDDAGRLTIKLGAYAQNQNYVGGYLLFTFAYHLRAFLDQKKVRHLLAAGLLLAVVLLTGSRGTLVSYVAVLTVSALICVKNSAHPAKNTLIALLLIAALLAVLHLALQWMPQEVAVRFSLDYIEEKGTTGRMQAWKALLSHFSRDHIGRIIFGHGYATTPLLNTYNGQVAHNLYLDNLMTLGVIGLTLQVATQCVCLYELAKSKNTAMLSAYVGFLVMCCSLSLTSYKPMWNVLMMALIYAKYRKSKGLEESITGYVSKTK